MKEKSKNITILSVTSFLVAILFLAGFYCFLEHTSIGKTVFDKYIYDTYGIGSGIVSAFLYSLVVPVTIVIGGYILKVKGNVFVVFVAPIIFVLSGFVIYWSDKLDISLQIPVIFSLVVILLSPIYCSIFYVFAVKTDKNSAT